MTLDIHDHILPMLTRLLEALSGYLDKASEHAKTHGYDVDNILRARLAIDQYDLAKQTSLACFHAEESMGQLTGKAAERWERETHDVADLQARIQHAIAFLGALNKADFAGWEEREADIFFAPGMFMPGMAYLMELELPNFFFHLNATYAILRHNGIPVGKMDYLGGLQLRKKG